MYMASLIGENIRNLRKAHGLTLEQLALAADTDTGGLSKLERGVQGYSDALLQRLARALGVTVAELFNERSNVEAAPIGTRRVPVLDYVQAGNWREVLEARSESDTFDYLLTDIQASPAAFALKIRGESMLPEFHEGDVVLVDPGVMPRPADFVVAKNSGHEAVFKQYRERGVDEAGHTLFELVPLNRFYPVLKSDVQHLDLVGTMIEHRKYRRRS